MLADGNVQKAFHHLKGWYRAATETQSKPCYHTMEHQTLERVDLYVRRQSPGNPLTIHLTPVKSTMTFHWTARLGQPQGN